MPWRETCAMNERMSFIVEAARGDETMSELCARYGISRKTGYKWVARHRGEGAEGLRERSRAPLVHGLARDGALVGRVLELRGQWPSWGPRKLRAKLGMLHPDWALPAASTIGDWLRREGLTRGRSVRRRCPPYTQPFRAITAANDVWSVDFKGWFRTKDGARCDPLTVSDAFSRYVLACQVVGRPDETHVRPVFDRLFCEYGLPLAIRSDNGPPFATVGAGGLSVLAVWWLKLGIGCERIEPGKPEQNGRHERMHGTLKAETAVPPATTVAAQQVRFDEFRRVFNEERPHEGLEQQLPAWLYAASPRVYPRALREPEYEAAAAVRRVRSTGQIKWGGEMVFISEVLIGEPVGITETAAGDWRVCYGPIELGFIGRKTKRLSRRTRSAGPLDR
jgi:putative transposase